ncbi:hypothetical protein Tco_0790531 [Tanacetum coccineum]
MKMEILLEPTSNKLMVEHAEYDESNTYVLERFNTTAGNPVKKILLKLNLSDHRILKDGGGVKEVQRSFRHSDTERLSRSDEVLKLKNFKKDATLKLSKSTNQERFSELHQLDTFYNALNLNDQDSLNSALGGSFLDKMPQECLKIIESKSKVHQSRSKAIVSKVSTSSSTPAVSYDVTKLKDMVRALILDKKNQTPAPAPIKAVEQSYVTCGGGHSYQNCPATDRNIYRDNNQEYVSQAAAVNYNQGNASYRPHMINQPPTFQAPPYQALAPAPPAPGVSKSDFDNYVKANDAVIQNMQNQMANITNPITKFMNSNTASTSGSGSLPSNIIANPKGDVIVITTRSGVSYNGAQISSLPKEMENEPEVTKDSVQPSTEKSWKWVVFNFLIKRVLVEM